MGLFSWLFPKPADRIAKARKLMADDRFAEARMEVADLSEAEAQALKSECEQQLVRMNLEKAVQRARAGEHQVVQSHLDLAERFHDGSMTELFEETNAALAALKNAQRTDAVWAELASAAERRARLGTDPGDFTLAAYSGKGAVRVFFGEGRAFNLPGLEYEPRAEWFRPSWMSECAGAEPDAVIAALKAVYPESLWESIVTQSSLLVPAIRRLADVAPEAAISVLLEGSLEEPVIAFELGRAAAALGQHQAAFLSFDHAIAAYEGALTVDGLSAQTWQAACALWAGDMKTAARVLKEADTSTAPYLRAVIEIESGDANEAEAALANIDEEDEQYPQLHSIVRLKRVLADLYEAFPVLSDVDAQGSPDWNDAMEEMLPQLQAELDTVMNQLQSDELDDEDEDEDDLDEAEPGADEVSTSP